MGLLNPSQFGGDDRVDTNIEWWDSPGERYLRVRTQGKRGLNDHASALDHMGAGSWAHGADAFLDERDAAKWLEHAGLNEKEVVRSRNVGRRPPGARNADPTGAIGRMMHGDAGNDYYAAMEAEAYDPDDPGPDVEPIKYDPRAPF